MAIIVSQIKTTLDQPKNEAVKKALSSLKLSPNEIKKAELYKTSIDARHEIVFVNSVYIELADATKEQKLSEQYANRS